MPQARSVRARNPFVRRVRLFALGALMFVGLSACEMTVRFSTDLQADGSGTFAVGVIVDAEARATLEVLAESTGDPAAGVEPIASLFTALEEVGWAVERSEPNGGLAFEATQTFTDPDDFGRVLDELGSARSSEGTGIGGLVFELDVNAERSFLRSRAGFSGLLDMTGIDPTPFGEELAAELQQRLRFEIRTSMPGGIEQIDDGAAVSGGVAVWRPAFGERTEFGATSSSLRAGNLLLVLAPALIALALLGWFLIGRGRDRTVHVPEGLSAIKTPVEPEGRPLQSGSTPESGSAPEEQPGSEPRSHTSPASVPPPSTDP